MKEDIHLSHVVAYLINYENAAIMRRISPFNVTSCAWMFTFAFASAEVPDRRDSGSGHKAQ